MANNRDPRKTSRTRRQLRTSSSGRSARSKASAKDTPRPTSSTDRASQQGKGSSKVTTGKGGKNVPPRGAQGPRTPPIQGPSRRVSGIIGTRQGSTSTPKKTPPTPGTKLGKPKTTVKPTTKGGKGGKGGSSALKTTLAAGMVTALATGSLRSPITAAKQRESKETRKKITKKSTDKYNTRDADGTVRSRAKVGPAKVGPKKVGTIAQAFDKAYATAKKGGKKTFTFKGKKYSTK
jgi:hypothetical protein